MTSNRSITRTPSTTIHLRALYAPSGSNCKTRFRYFTNDGFDLASLPNHNDPNTFVIMGGDLNDYPNPCDRDPPNVFMRGQFWHALEVHLIAHHIVEPYRLHNSEGRLFTRAETREGLEPSFTRLDHFLISESLLGLVRTITTDAIEGKDHLVLKMSLQADPEIDKPKRGVGAWSTKRRIIHPGRYQNAEFRARLFAYAEQIKDATSAEYDFSDFQNVKNKLREVGMKLAFVTNRKGRECAADRQARLDELELLAQAAATTPNRAFLALIREMQALNHDHTASAQLGLTKRVPIPFANLRPHQLEMIAGRRHKDTAIRTLVDPASGLQTHEPDQIDRIVVAHLKKIWSPPTQTMVMTHGLARSIRHSRLTEQLTASLSKEYTANEVRARLKKTSSRSAPGSDGLSFQFYKCLPEEYLGLIASRLNNLSHGLSDWSTEDARVVVTLIHKHGPRDAIDKYRPLSLSNCHTRLMSGVNANRISAAAAEVFPTWQSAFLRQRSAIDNVIALAAMIQLQRIGAGGDGLALILCDQEKAYDRVDRDWLFLCMRLFGVPQHITNFYRGFYQAITAVAQSMTGYTEAFELRKGVLQGDPASTILYSISLLPLLNAIEHDPSTDVGWQSSRLKACDGWTEPIKVPYLAYADDMAQFVTSEDGLKRIIELTEQYETQAGSRLSLEKTTIAWNGDQDHVPSWVTNAPFSAWTAEKARTLGVMIDQEGVACKEQFNKMLEMCNTRMMNWARSDLDLAGKVTAATTFLLSKFWYTSQIGYTHPGALRTLGRMLHFFLFPSSRGIRLKKMAAPRDHGGLGLLDVTSMASALKLRAFFSQVRQGGERARLVLTLFQESFVRCTRVHPYHFIFWGYRKPGTDSLEGLPDMVKGIGQALMNFRWCISDDWDSMTDAEVCNLPWYNTNRRRQNANDTQRQGAKQSRPSTRTRSEERAFTRLATCSGSRGVTTDWKSQRMQDTDFVDHLIAKKSRQRISRPHSGGCETAGTTSLLSIRRVFKIESGGSQPSPSPAWIGPTLRLARSAMKKTSPCRSDFRPRSTYLGT